MRAFDIVTLVLVLMNFSILTEANNNEKADQIITQILNSFKNKLEASPLSKVDIEVITLLLNLIKHRQERIEEERQNGPASYWRLRQGRSTDLQI